MEQKILNNALRYVLDLLEQVNYYPYHNINHTLEVYGRCSYLCDKEFVYLQDKTDILLAALFHDTWFTKQYNKNEEIWAIIARQYLKNIWFEEFRIKNIENMIMATIVFNEPKNKLEQIIQDADFDNLWREDCIVKTMSLKKELLIASNTKIALKDWLMKSYNLLRIHTYNTKTAKDDRDEGKLINIKIFEKKLNLS
jgi:uncharacterized protein